MNIEGMTDGELETLYQNCVEAIDKGKSTAAQAQRYIDEINAVWRVRLSAAQAGQYKADRPEEGPLKKLGYKVGNGGVSAEKRRRLLDWAMERDLPFVGSPAYMLEWGEPRSAKRYRKLHTSLTVFRSGARTLGTMQKADDDWSQDLAYIEAAWKAEVR